MIDDVKIGILGPLRVHADGRDVTVSAHQQRVVLATLALHAPRVLRPSELIDVLWGDDPPATAVKSLQTYVARLRRVLPVGWIASTPDGYRLGADPADVDAWRFEQAVARGARALRAFEYADAAARLAEARALWRGDPVDLGDQRRGTSAAARLRELRLAAEEDHAQARIGLGCGEELVPELEAAAGDEPLRERRWEQLMVALYRAGRQADALRAYQRVRTLLVDNLGIEPGPELRAVERAVLDQSPTLDPPPGSRILPTTPQTPLPATLQALARPPMAGRTAEVEQLADQWRRAVAGECRVALVHGAAGMGKTRLAAAAAATAHADGAQVLFGACDPRPLTPYPALVEALRPLAWATAGTAGDATAPWEVAELARLVPEFGERLGVAPAPLGDEAGARHLLFESVAGLLRRTSRLRPTVLVLDDVQWIDPASAALVRHLVRSRPGSLLVLGTHRSGDPDSDARLASLSALVPAEAGPELVAVGPLGFDAVCDLTGDRRSAELVHSASGGSPLFVTELLRFRADAGRLPGPGEVPGGLRQALVRRIVGLRPAARRVTQAAAVIGSQADIADLARVVDLPEEAVRDAVDDAVAGHVLRVSPDAPGSVRFTHDLVRATVLAETSVSRRGHLHGRIGTLLAQLAPPDRAPRAAEVAHHLAAARGEEPVSEVAPWALRAAEAARGQLAWEDAASHLELALRHTPRRQLVERMHVLTRLGDVARAAGHENAARTHYLEAISLGREAGVPEAVAEIVLAWAAIPVDVRTDLQDVIGLMRAALGGLEDGDSALRARLTGRLAFSLAWARDPDSRTLADAAVAMARRTGDPVALAQSLFFASSSRDQFEAFDLDGAAGDLLSLVPELTQPHLAAQALLAAAVGSVQRSDRGAAEELLARVEAMADTHHLVEAGFRARVARAHLSLADGHLAVADRAADELLDRAGRSELANLFLFAGALQYDVRRAQGRLPELLWWFDEVERSGQDIARVPAMRAEVLAAAGRRDEAATLLTKLVGGLDELVAPAERPHSIATLATVAAQVGDHEAARVLHAVLAPWQGRVVYDGVNGPLEPVDHFLGMLDVQPGERSRAWAG